jgi:hypothetical protein
VPPREADGFIVAKKGGNARGAERARTESALTQEKRGTACRSTLPLRENRKGTSRHVIPRRRTGTWTATLQRLRTHLNWLNRRGYKQNRRA